MTKTFYELTEELKESPFGNHYNTSARAKNYHDDHQNAIRHHENQMAKHATAQARAEKKGDASKAEHHEEAGMEHHFAAEAHRDAQAMLKKLGPDHHEYEAKAKSAHSISKHLR